MYNIKAACVKHFNSSLECDVLAGERGPSYSDASQIQNWKLLHVRFVEPDESVCASKEETKSIPSLPPVYVDEPSRSEPNVPSPKKTTDKGKVPSSVPASISLSQMLKLGKIIQPKVDIVTLQLQEFSITEMWQEPFKAKFLLQRESFAKGGLREAFIAKAISGMPTRGKYVLKKYQKDKEENVLQYSPTLEEHTRKIVQMNALARNFAQSLELERPKDYGETFSYEKIYFSSINGECITLERFIEGKFKKLINNTGEVLGDDIDDISLKAEAFVHYTYVSSDEQLMVTDIQGVGYTLCDPEIASTAQQDEDKSKLFCCGNLSELAIRGFLNGHSCNKFCNLLKLSDDNRN